MSAPSLENKTIRPGNLGAYSYYRSNRTPAKPQIALLGAGRRKLLTPKIILILLVAAAVIGIPLVSANSHTVSSKKAATAVKPPVHKSTPPAPAAKAVVAAPAKAPDNCASNSLSKLVLVSVSQRHLWACDGGTTVYDSPVITGMSAYAATVTPPGTYHIYSKQTNLTLRGSDVTGSWSDPVSYWMPFLDNQYGAYGLHDATWRDNSAFGNISPDSSDASHGCVELPLATSAWLYSWVYVGTAVTIES